MSSAAAVVEQYGDFLFLAIGILSAVTTGYWIVRK
jgi:hypothetical protein